jgi:hypothetical protein
VAHHRKFAAWGHIRWLNGETLVETASLASCWLAPCPDGPHQRAVAWGSQLWLLLFGRDFSRLPSWQLVVLDGMATFAGELEPLAPQNRAWFTTTDTPLNPEIDWSIPLCGCSICGGNSAASVSQEELQVSSAPPPNRSTSVEGAQLSRWGHPHGLPVCRSAPAGPAPDPC